MASNAVLMASFIRVNNIQFYSIFENLPEVAPLADFSLSIPPTIHNFSIIVRYYILARPYQNAVFRSSRYCNKIIFWKASFSKGQNNFYTMINAKAQKMLFVFILFFSIYIARTTHVFAAAPNDEPVVDEQRYYIAFYVPESAPQVNENENLSGYNENTDSADNATGEQVYISPSGFMGRVGRSAELFLGNVRNAGLMSWLMIMMIAGSMYVYANKIH